MLNLHAWFTFFFSSSNHHTTPWFTWPLDAQETHPNELKRFGFTCCCSENNDEFSVNVDERQRPSTVLPSPGRHTGKPVGFWGDAKRIEIEMLGGSVFVFWPPFKIWSRKFTACKYFLALSYWSFSRMHTCQFVMLRTRPSARPSAVFGQFHGSGLDEKNYYTVVLILGPQPYASS